MTGATSKIRFVLVTDEGLYYGGMVSSPGSCHVNYRINASLAVVFTLEIVNSALVTQPDLPDLKRLDDSSWHIAECVGDYWGKGPLDL